jgi:hypothetical protein
MVTHIELKTNELNMLLITFVHVCADPNFHFTKVILMGIEADLILFLVLLYAVNNQQPTTNNELGTWNNAAATDVLCRAAQNICFHISSRFVDRCFVCILVC